MAASASFFHGSAKPAAEQINGFHQEVVDEFRANGGKAGGIFEGVPLALRSRPRSSRSISRGQLAKFRSSSSCGAQPPEHDRRGRNSYQWVR
ncbi:hypothetical protein [Segniliparus rotundus]|uniref:hypothetical protein n=1 Tax=Segniliparus rotundus TaxID=286802 RepID=UPI00059DD89B|nr:hypothetical protein [Segniliparus rotundus]